MNPNGKDRSRLHDDYENVWLKHIEDLPEMEKRFCDYFEEGKFLARMTSTTEFIVDGCLLMIDGIAYR